MFSKAIALLLLTKTVIVLTLECQNLGSLQVFHDPTCSNGKVFEKIESLIAGL